MYEEFILNESYCYYMDVGGRYEKVCVEEQFTCECLRCICRGKECWRGCGGVASSYEYLYAGIGDQLVLDKWIIDYSLTHEQICMQMFNTLLSVSVPVTYWGLSCEILREERGYVAWTALMINSRLLAMDIETLTEGSWHCFANIVPYEGSWYKVQGMYKYIPIED
jgi:hypothetical protein